MIASSMG